MRSRSPSRRSIRSATPRSGMRLPPAPSGVEGSPPSENSPSSRYSSHRSRTAPGRFHRENGVDNSDGKSRTKQSGSLERGIALRQPCEERFSHAGKHGAGGVEPCWIDSAFAAGIPRRKELLQQLVDEAAARPGRENRAILRRLIEPQDVRGKKLERTILIALEAAQ